MNVNDIEFVKAEHEYRMQRARENMRHARRHQAGIGRTKTHGWVRRFGSTGNHNERNN